MRKKVSVIIPNYNHANYLEKRITTVINQSFQDFEIIILDDCSTDNSRPIIESFRNNPKITAIEINNTNSGSPFFQWKKGIEMASGEWIWIAESDDYADSKFLETAFKEIAKYPDAGVFYCDSFYDTQYGEPYRFSNSSEFKNHYFETNKWSQNYCNSGIAELNNYLKFICTIINSSSALFKKKYLMNSIDDLNKFRYHGDWFCMIQCALQTNICYSSEKLNTCRMHKNNFLNSIDKSKSKEEYFMILSCLISSDKITEKRKLIKFFTQQFIGFGIFSDGPKHGFLLVKKYFRINSSLCRKFIIEYFFQKISFRQRKTIY